MMAIMMVLMVLGVLLFIVVLAGAIWLLVRWLNKSQTPPMPDAPRPQYPYQRYEQGYQTAQPMSEIYQEAGWPDRYPQPKQEHDQPKVPYPQEQEMPPRGQ
jgi:hypothetical protein